jgi:hypothetical protein
VKIYRVLASGAKKRVLGTSLDASGHFSVRLGKHDSPGTEVTMVAKVQTGNGRYRSERVQITVRG